jgi:parallel beta-helix repeat protein
MAKGYPDYRLFSVPISVVEGGTGTDSPTLSPGPGIEITGSWPNHTIINTSPASALGDPVAVAHGGTGTTTGSITGTGALTFAAGGTDKDIKLTPSGLGNVLVPRLNKIRFADQFPGADAGAKIAAAIADLPSTGGTVDARGLEGAQNVSTPLVINKPVRLLLGSATYTLPTGSNPIAATGFDVESDNVQIIGNGSTVLQATRDWANGTFYAIGVFGFTGFVAEGLDIRITTTGTMPTTTYAIEGICVRGARTTYDPPSTNFRIANNRIWVRGAVTDETNAKQSAIWIFGGSTSLRAKGGVISDNVLDDSHGRGIYLYDAENVTIAENVVRNLGSTIVGGGTARGIRIIGSRAVSVVGNTIISPGSAGYVRGITVEGDTANSDITITGNAVHFDGAPLFGGAGAWVENSSYVNFTGNVLAYAGENTGSNDGLRVYTESGAYPVSNVDISNNVIYGWTGYQVDIYDSGPTDVFIASNMLGRSVGGASNYYQINSGATRVNYASNVEGDSAGVRFRQAAPSFSTGLLAGDATSVTNRTVRALKSYTSPTTAPYITDSQLYLTETTAPNATPAIVSTKSLGILSSNTQNWTGSLILDQSAFSVIAGAAGTFSVVTAYQSSPSVGAGTVSYFYGFRARANSGGGTITNKWSFNGEAGAGIAEFADGVKTANQFVSTLATGTPPLVVSSTTEVANLRSATATDLAAGSILSVAKGGTGRGAGQLPVYANNAAAKAGGLAVGDFYRTGADPDLVCVVH